MEQANQEEIREEVAGSNDVEVSQPRKTYTIDEIVQKGGFGKFQAQVLLMAGLFWMADAIEMMMMAFLPIAISCDFDVSPLAAAGMAVSVFIGMVIGEIFWGVVADKMGRKKAIFCTSLIGLVFGVLSAFSPSLFILSILRGIVGFGTGGSDVAYALFAEFLPADRRGFWLLFINVFWATGTLLMCLISWALLPDWRKLLIATAVPELIVLILFFVLGLPESPRYHLISGEPDKATQIVQKMCDMNGIELDGGLLEVVEGDKGRLADLLAPKMRRSTWLLWAIWFLNTFIYYGFTLITPVLLSNEGPDGVRCGKPIPDEQSSGCQYIQTDQYIGTVVTVLGEFPGLICLALAIDEIGRKPSQGVGMLIVGFFFFTLTTCYTRTIELILLFGLRAVIAASFQVYPTCIRTTGLGVCASFSRMGGVITPFIVHLFADDVQDSFVLFGVCAILNALLVLFLPRETSRKPLENSVGEVTAIFNADIFDGGGLDLQDMSYLEDLEEGSFSGSEERKSGEVKYEEEPKTIEVKFGESEE